MVVSVESGYPTANNNYTTLRDAVIFKGVSLASGKNLTKIAPNTNRIEFIGDSLTAGLRVLYTGSDSPAAAAPEFNFPELVARALGCEPVVMAHGGQGITTSGTDGFPAATASWRKAASGVDYAPAVEPIAVVIYYATNDNSFTQAQYTALLDAVRASCPNAIIFAVVPYNQSSKAANIQAAVAAGDADMVYLDYSSVIVSADTTDNTHQNPGGAVELVAKLEQKYSEQVEILQQIYRATMDIAKIKAKILTKIKARTQEQTQVKVKQLVQAVVVMLSYGQNTMIKEI